MPETTSKCAEIVERIAAREGVDPLDLNQTLSDAIDVDALDALANGVDNRPSRSKLRIEFTYHGYAVIVDGGGEITIDEEGSESKTFTSSI